jgi:hypothetical protein
VKARAPLHGRDHRPGGSDPIPGLAGGTNMWPIGYQFPLFNRLGTGAAKWARVEIGPTPAVPYNATLNNYSDYVSGTRTALDGDYFYCACRLGPKDSAWAFNWGGFQGPDFGNWTMDIGTIAENTDGTLEDITGATYINIGTSHTGYNATQVRTANEGDMGFVIRGDDGDPLAAVTSDPTYGKAVDGGPGIFCFKFNLSGKSGSSTGYKAALWELVIARVDDGSNEPYA